VEFMLEHKDDFAPFIEVKFEDVRLFGCIHLLFVASVSLVLLCNG